MFKIQASKLIVTLITIYVFWVWSIDIHYEDVIHVLLISHEEIRIHRRKGLRLIVVFTGPIFSVLEQSFDMKSSKII